MNTNKIAKMSMLISISVVLGLLESFIPIFNGVIPGIKLGLANIVILYILYKYSFKEALYVSILRVFLIGILRTGLFSITFFFSLSGAILSIIFMYIFKRYTKLSVIGISIIGAITHSIGQIIIAIIFLSDINIIYYFPFLLLSSVITGIIVGIISKKLIEELDK